MRWLIRLLSRFDRNRLDPYAVMQTPKPVNGPYDYDKAKAGYHRARAHTATGRPLSKPTGSVVRFERKAGER